MCPGEFQYFKFMWQFGQKLQFFLFVLFLFSNSIFALKKNNNNAGMLLVKFASNTGSENRAKRGKTSYQPILFKKGRVRQYYVLRH